MPEHVNNQNKKIDLKTVSSNGQISIGRELAGQQVQLLEQEDGSLLIKKGPFTINYENN
jgi:hypothetical protein